MPWLIVLVVVALIISVVPSLVVVPSIVNLPLVVSPSQRVAHMIVILCEGQDCTNEHQLRKLVARLVLRVKVVTELDIILRIASHLKDRLHCVRQILLACVNLLTTEEILECVLRIVLVVLNDGKKHLFEGGGDLAIHISFTSFWELVLDHIDQLRLLNLIVDKLEGADLVHAQAGSAAIPRMELLADIFQVSVIEVREDFL
jgi:hypothetical protein